MSLYWKYYSVNTTLGGDFKHSPEQSKSALLAQLALGNTQSESLGLAKSYADDHWLETGFGQTSHLDWVTFRGKIPANKIDDVIATSNLLNEKVNVNDDFYKIDPDGVAYHTMYQTLQGLTVLIGDVVCPQTGEVLQGFKYCKVECSGTFLSWTEFKRQLRSFSILYGHYALRCTRLDLATDDWAKRLDIDYINEVCKAKDRWGFKNRKYIDSDTAAGEGKTIYLGSPTSEKYVKIYETKVKHPDIDTIRVEHKFGRDIAHRAMGFLIGCKPEASDADVETFDVKEYDRQYGELMLRFVKWAMNLFGFIDRSKGKNLSRAKNLPFWQEFLDRFYDEAPPADISTAKPRPTMEKKIAWVVRSVSRSLFMIKQGFKEAFGNDRFTLFLRDIIKDGELRMRSQDWQLITDYLQFAET